MEIEIYEANNSGQVVDEGDTDEWRGWSGLAESIIARLQPRSFISLLFSYPILLYRSLTRVILFFPFRSLSPFLFLVSRPTSFCGTLRFISILSCCDIMDCVFNETAVRPPYRCETLLWNYDAYEIGREVARNF